MVRRDSARRAGSDGRLLRAGRLFMLPTVFVFYWMITLSLKPQVEATAYPPSFFRFSVTLAGYREVFTKYPFLLYTWNSLVVAAGCTALGLAVGLPAAYSIARWRQQRLAAGHPGGAHHPRHRLPDPLVHLLSPDSGWSTPTAR